MSDVWEVSEQMNWMRRREEDKMHTPPLGKEFEGASFGLRFPSVA